MTDTGIALLGFMGAGKSTVGQALASRLGWRFIDLDREFVAQHGPIDLYFREFGEAAFRSLERELIDAISPERTVVALGGGATIDPGSRGAVERRFHTVFLDAPLSVCAERVGTGAGRPVWGEAAERFESRQPAYRSARTRVNAVASVEHCVEAILAERGRRQERVELGARSYDVVLSDSFEGLSERISGDLRIVTDDRVGPLWGEALQRELPGVSFAFPAGEVHKTLQTWQAVVTDLIGSRTRRDTTIVALGGGVVGDLAGFAAATVNRGLPLVQVPTTSLAMIDSSVGGKTAVNHPMGKNLVGAFHQPRAVWINTRTLSTLDPREHCSGLAEALKMAVTLDPVLLDVIEALAPQLRQADPGATAHVVALSIRNKARVVAEDERETGRRMVLNAGHTVGHGLERAAGYGALLHGEAVAIGLIAECRWAAQNGHCPSTLPERLVRITQALGLPTEPPPGLRRQAVLDAMAVDKKAARDILHVPVPAGAGTSVCIPLPLSALDALLPEFG